MVRRYNRLLVAFHVVTDALLGMVAFILAYFVRFETGLIPAPKGQPPLAQYLDILPFIAVIVPLAFHLQGLYRLRRGRSRIDDFFNVLVGSIIAVGLRRGDDAVCRHLCRSGRAQRSARTRSRSRSGASSCCSTSRWATCRASSCAKRSSVAGPPASGCGAS